MRRALTLILGVALFGILAAVVVASQGADDPVGTTDTVTETVERTTTVEDNPNRVVSIYGAVRLANQSDGIADVLVFLFTINLFVGIFNLVPLLPLDGGHVAIATYERIRSRKGRPYHADISKLMPLTYAVVLLLVLVGVTSLYLDIANPLDLQ